MAGFLFAKRGHLTQLQMHRHGSRGPASTDEENMINSLVNTLEDGRDVIQNAHLPENLQFLKNGYDFRMEAQSLSMIGRQQLFNHGVEYAMSHSLSLPLSDADVCSRFGLKYPNFTTDTLLSSDVQRVIDSMYFFAQGRFGREIANKTLLTVKDTPDPVSWITPWKHCPGYDSQYGAKASNQVSYTHSIITLMTGAGGVELHVPASHHLPLE